MVETDEGIRPELEFVTGNGGPADCDGEALIAELEIPVPDKLVAIVRELVLLAASEEDRFNVGELGKLLDVLVNDVYVVESIDGLPDTVYGVELPETPVPFELELGDTVSVIGTDTKLGEEVLVVLTKGKLVFVFVFVPDALDGAERVEFDNPEAVVMGLDDGNDTGSIVEFGMGELEAADGVIVEENVVDALVLVPALVVGLEDVVSETGTEVLVIFAVEIADDEIRLMDETEPIVLFGKTGTLLGITANTDDDDDTVDEEIYADDDEKLELVELLVDIDDVLADRPFGEVPDDELPSLVLVLVSTAEETLVMTEADGTNEIGAEEDI